MKLIHRIFWTRLTDCLSNMFYKIGKRISLKFWNFSLSHCFASRDFNKFITLGVNCFPRTKLVKFGIKPKKKQGELSFPFDLCAIPLESIDKILINDFNDYFKDLKFNSELNIWENSKYAIKYWHDKNIGERFFIDRYKQRIANFHNITQNQKNLFFISVIFDSSYNLELYTSIYNSLQRYCRFDFKYLIINVVKDYSSHMKDDIARNLYYREILEPLNDYSKIWTMHQLDKQYFSQMLSFYQKFVKLVLEL